MPTQTPILSTQVSFRLPNYIIELMEKRVVPNGKTEFFIKALQNEIARTPLLSEHKNEDGQV